jgi:hypothetical protein
MADRITHIKTFKIGFHLFLMVTLLTATISVLFVNGQAHAAGSIFYVSTTGNDSNPGTLSSPWKTIQKAANSLSPGDTVYVRGGIYKELVYLNVTGSLNGGFINFENYANEIPILDGTGITPTGSKQTFFYLSNVKYVRIKGFEMRNLKAASNSLDPAGILVANGSTNIEILNNNIHHIENSATNGNAHGIHVIGNTTATMSNITVSGNEVHHLITGWSESVTINGNVDGFMVTNNKVHDNNNIGIVVAGFYGACPGACTDQVRNGVVANNTVYRIDTSKNPAYGSGTHAAGGIYADGATKVVIERNHVYENDFGIELASENYGKATSLITVKNNLIHHNYGAGLLMGGSGSENGSARDNTASNNTLVENDSLNQGYGEIYLQNNTHDNKIVNNIIYTNAQKIVMYKINKSGTGNVIDYNLVYSPGGVSGTNWSWESKNYNSWSAYTAGTGNDNHSIFAQPLFVDKLNNDYRLQLTSSGYGGGYGLISSTNVLTEAPTPTPTPTPIETPTPAVASIGVDGSVSDWSEVSAISTGTSNIKSLKVANNDTKLFLLAQGVKMTSKTQIYINSDNIVTTGFRSDSWSSSGADYMVESGILYKYNGSGTDWSWTQKAVLIGTSEYFVKASLIELSIPLTSLGIAAGKSIGMGFLWNDSINQKLPKSGGLAKFTIK